MCHSPNFPVFDEFLDAHNADSHPRARVRVLFRVDRGGSVSFYSGAWVFAGGFGNASLCSAMGCGISGGL